jgi:hypothetical protein
VTTELVSVVILLMQAFGYSDLPDEGGPGRGRCRTSSASWCTMPSSEPDAARTAGALGSWALKEMITG